MIFVQTLVRTCLISHGLVLKYIGCEALFVRISKHGLQESCI